MTNYFVKQKHNKKIKYLAIGIGILFILAVPFIFQGYPIRLATTIVMYVGFAQIWNILGGFAGYISLGLVGFIGMGAYVAGVLMNLGVNPYLAMLMAGIFSAIVSAILSVPLLRLKAGYYSIATFAIAFVFREIASNLTEITGGGIGLALPLIGLDITGMNRYFYYAMLVLAIIITLICYRISKSSLGYGLHAIKEDEEATNVLESIQLFTSLSVL